MHPANPDWAAVAQCYQFSHQSLRELASQHGVPESTIRARAKRAGWSRPAQLEESGKMLSTERPLVPQADNAATLPVNEADCGLRIHRMCLASLEGLAGSATDAREIKIIVDTTSAAIEAIRRISEVEGGKAITPATMPSGHDWLGYENDSHV